jgi:hypothetical protein
VHELLVESPVTPQRNLWLVVPDTWPDGLKVVWLVLGKTPDDMHSVTVPVERDEIQVVIAALARVRARKLAAAGEAPPCKP